MRLSSTRGGAAAVVLALTFATTTPGCAPGTPEVDQAARYTPESLAQELAFRYRGLRPEGKKPTRGAGSRSTKTAADLARDEQAQKKARGADAAEKRAGPPTLDDVMDDIDAKLDKIPGTPRPEARRQMIDALAKDASLSAEDRTLLSDRLKGMGES
jgi:hypothetical protein